MSGGLPLTELPAPAPLCGPTDGCWNCPTWIRRGSAVGLCKGKTHKNSLSSYIHICRDHPKHPEHETDTQVTP